NLSADAIATADHQSDLAAEFRFGRHALKLGFLQRPVFDLECLAARQRDVVVKLLETLGLLRTPRVRQWMGHFAVLQSVRAGHDVDGVDEEFRGNARFLLVLSKAEQADAWNDDYRGIGVSKPR